MSVAEQPLLERLPAHPLVVYSGEPHTDAWHAARRLGLGGSDVAAALGLDEWRSPYEVYLEKTSPGAPVDDAGEPAQWGTRLEPVVAQWAADELGAGLHAWPSILQQGEHAWMRASLDRLLELDNRLHVLEVKVSRWERAWDADDLPQRAEVQARWYLAVTGLEEAVVAALLHGTRGELRRIRRDERIERYLVDEAERFWTRVAEHHPPIFGERELAAGERLAKALRQTSSVEGLSRELGSEWHERLEERRFLRAERAELERDLERIDNLLRAELGEAEVGLLDGEIAVTHKPVTQRRVDLAALTAEHPELAAHYKRPSTTRKLLVKEARDDVDAA